MSGSDRLTGKDAKLLEALLLGGTQRQAAEHAGYGEATVRRRLQQPRFRAELRKAEDAAIAVVRRQLVAVAPLAVDRLRRAMDDPKVTGPQVQAMSRLAQLAVNRLLPAQVEVGGQLTVHQPDATPILDRVRAHLADIQAARAETDPAVLEAMLAGPTPPSTNGNGASA